MDFKKYLIMKRFLIILAISFFAVSTAFSTEQTPDILIIGNDTIYLNYFPLEDLVLSNKLSAPFDYGGYSFPHTGCWRGYVATWQVVEDNLVLKEVRKLDTEKTKLDIIEYLENNGYNPKIINGFVVADWYSDVLIARSFYGYTDDRFVLDIYYRPYRPYDPNEHDRRAELIFENGKLIENNIIPIEDYKVGDTLYVDIQYFQDWYIWSNYKKAQIKGVIRENNGKMVKLEIVSYGTDNERVIRRIQKTMKATVFGQIQDIAKK